MSTLAFYAQFVSSKVGTNGLTVTWDVEQITRSDGTRVALVTGGATTITIGRRGLYGYLLAGADTKLYDYIATAITATTTVDQQEVAALWTVYEADAVKLAGVAAVAGAIPGVAAGASGGLPVLDANLVSAANVTMQQGVAVAAADENGNVPVVLANANHGGEDATFMLKQFLVTVDFIAVLPAVTVDLASIGMAVPNLDAQLAALPTDQDVRDAMKLAPTAGDPAAGSMDKHLDDLLTYADAAEPADVWSYVSRTLTATPASTTDGTTAGAITRKRGNSWSIALTLGAITGYTSLWFTIKRSYDDADSASVVQVKLNATGLLDGLLYVNGAAATNDALGGITVSDASTGAIVVALDETVTDDIAPGTYYYDAQALISGAVTTPDSGTFTVTADVTRSVT